MRNKIVYFGSYHPKYSRNILTKKAFTSLGFRVIDCQDSTGGLSHYFRLIKRYLKIQKDSDVIFIGVLGHYDLPIAWFLAKIFKKSTIFDCFYSLYDTYVSDRKTTNAFSLNALRFYLYDWISVRLADKVILDTKENIDYFVKTFKISKTKFAEVPVTADPDVFKYAPKKNNRIFAIGFYGSFLPLHGVDRIILAMKLINTRNVQCILTGKGYEVKKIRKMITDNNLSKKVHLYEKKTAYKDLPKFLKKLDLFLAGPFGQSDKAKRVLPAKAVEALASGVPTIVANTPATVRLLKDYKNDVIWLKNTNPIALSGLIMSVYSAKKRSKSPNFQLKSLGFENYKNKLKNIVLN